MRMLGDQTDLQARREGGREGGRGGTGRGGRERERETRIKYFT